MKFLKLMLAIFNLLFNSSSDFYNFQQTILLDSSVEETRFSYLNSSLHCGLFPEQVFSLKTSLMLLNLSATFPVSSYDSSAPLFSSSRYDLALCPLSSVSSHAVRLYPILCVMLSESYFYL